MKLSWRPHYRTLHEQIAFDKLVEEIKAARPTKPKPIKPDGMSDEEFIISLQTPHAQSVLKMDGRELSEYQSRALPTNWKANPNAKTNDESVGMRDIDPFQADIIESIRRAEKNTIGASEKRAIDEHIDLSAMLKIKERKIELRAPKEIWAELTLWQAIKHWIKGNKVKSVSKE